MAGGTVAPQRCPTGPFGVPQAQMQATSLSAEPLVPKSPAAEPTQEGGAPGDEETRGEALRLLHAKGLVLPLGGGRDCPACDLPIRFEAAYPCSKCLALVHVRCLQVQSNQTPLTVPTAAAGEAPAGKLRASGKIFASHPVVYSHFCVKCV